MKALSQRQRWLVLGGALGATLLAVLSVGDDGADAPAVAVASRASRPQAAAGATAGRLPLDALQKRRGGESAVQVDDVFPAQSWYVPPPAPPTPRTPPPLPFAHLATLREPGAVTVFLAHGDRTIPVKAGDLIDGAYRVESVDARRVIFTHLPLGMRQTLVIGGVENEHD